MQSHISFPYMQTTWHLTPSFLLHHNFCFSDPEFISSSLDPAEKKLYFFFSEVGKEFIYAKELRVARVAQVCKVTVITGRGPRL